MNAQKGCFSLRFFYRADQCERIKTEVFLSVFVRKRSSVNGSFEQSSVNGALVFVDDILAMGTADNMARTEQNLIML